MSTKRKFSNKSHLVKNSSLWSIEISPKRDVIVTFHKKRKLKSFRRDLSPLQYTRITLKGRNSLFQFWNWNDVPIRFSSLNTSHSRTIPQTIISRHKASIHTIERISISHKYFTIQNSSTRTQLTRTLEWGNPSLEGAYKEVSDPESGDLCSDVKTLSWLTLNSVDCKLL